jgi:hypothetical protein
MRHVVKLSHMKRGSVPLPRREVVKRTFAWMRRFCRLAKDFERPLKTVAGLHFVVLACIMLARCFATSASHARDPRRSHRAPGPAEPAGAAISPFFIRR